MPELVAYPAGPVAMVIGKPVDLISALLLLQELLYEFNMEVSRCAAEAAPVVAH